MFNKLNINYLYKKYNIFHIIGNNYNIKQKCKLFIKNKINSLIKKNININILIDKNFNWNIIKNNIINKEIYYLNKLLIINIIEKYKEINKIIYNNIILHIKNYNIKNIFIIINYEHDYYNNNIIKKNKKNLIIKFNSNKNYYNKYIYYDIKYKYIKNIFLFLKKKKINKLLNIINNIKNNINNKILLINILFKYFTNNIYKFNKIKINKILNLIKKLEIKIKKNINISLINIQLIIILLFI